MKKIFISISICIPLVFLFILLEKKATVSFLQKKAVVFIALDPECPLSISYTKKINDLHFKYKDQVFFILFFPGNHYTNKEIKKFMNTYNLPMHALVDRNLILTKIFNAEVVPEVFVINNKRKIIYKGLIDNWIGELGRKKQYVNKDYLIDAIESSLNNSLPLITSTEAIGCLIEK